MTERITIVQAARALGLHLQTAHTRLRVRRACGDFIEGPGDRVGTMYFLPLDRWRALIGEPKGRAKRPKH